MVFFFFSSRRRHTRLQGDWSSDVCSSDLHQPGGGYCTHEERGGCCESQASACSGSDAERTIGSGEYCARSEERRVGKECSNQWSPRHLKKKRMQMTEHATDDTVL